MSRASAFSAAFLAYALAIGPACAADLYAPAPVSSKLLKQNVFVLGGASVGDGDIFSAANPFTAHYEDNIVVGGGYQRFFYESLNISIGVEAGLAGRFGDKNSAEVWGGVVGRYDGFVLFETLKIAPAFTFGLSAVTGTMAGREERLEAESGGDATLLFYLGPELNFSLAAYPNAELFWRIHHRSGALGTLGDMDGAANANVVGARIGF